ARAQSPAIEITAPNSGSVVAPGQQVTVSIRPLNGFTPSAAIVVGPSVASPMTGPTFSTAITIPSEAAGPFTLLVVAKDVNDAALSTEVTIQVVPTAPLIGISVNPPQLYFTSSTSKNQWLSVYGTYGDGVTRDIRSLPNTIYQSDSPLVATV